jgi:hypothetical protein
LSAFHADPRLYLLIDMTKLPRGFSAKATVTALSLCILALAALSFTGCAGYQMGSIKPQAYSHIRTISVPTFENRTLEPRVSVLVTNAVIKQMQMDGTYQIATKDQADAELRGVITRIERQQLRSARIDTFTSTELQSYLVVRWALYDPTTGEKLDYSQASDIDENNLENTSGLKVRPGQNIGRTIVFLDPNFQTSERGAIPVAAQKAAEQLVSQLSEGW